MSETLVFADVFKHFVPVLKTTELKRRPLPIRVANRKYVLFRDNAGRVGALLDRCPHRFTPLSIGKVTEGGRLQCAYHGWHFDVNGNGCAPSQPAMTGCNVAALQAIERHGYIWLANPGISPDSIDRMEWKGFFPANREGYVIPAPLHVALANTGDTEHSPYVHPNRMLNESAMLQSELRMERSEDEIVVTLRNPVWRKFGARIAGARNCDLEQAEMIYRFDPLRVTFTISWVQSATGELGPTISRAVLYIVPESDAITRVHTFRFLKMSGAGRLSHWVGRMIDASFYRGLFREDGKIALALSEIPFDTKGMRLGKHDQALPAILGLLKKHCYTTPDS